MQKIHFWSRWNLYKTTRVNYRQNLGPLLCGLHLNSHKSQKGLRSSGTIPKICKLSMLHHHHAFQGKTRKIELPGNASHLLLPSNTWQCETRTQPWTWESHHKFQPGRLSLRKWGRCLLTKFREKHWGWLEYLEFMGYSECTVNVHVSYMCLNI